MEEIKQEKYHQQLQQQEVTEQDGEGSEPVTQDHKKEKDSNFDDLWRLSANMEQIKAHQDVNKRIHIMNDILEDSIQEAHPTIFVEASLVKDEPVIELICRVKVNSFGLWNQTKDKSYGTSFSKMHSVSIYILISFCSFGNLPAFVIHQSLLCSILLYTA